MDTHVALLHPRHGRPPGASWASLPPDLLRQAATRLQILSLLYAAVFFLAGVFPVLFVAESRNLYLSRPAEWLPSLLAITMALAFWGVLRSGRLALPTVMTLGLWFEVLTCYGIAAAELVGIPAMPPDSTMVLSHGLSWVAVWVLLFTIVIPAPPHRVVAAALASVAAVPLSLLGLQAVGLSHVRLTPAQFFFGMVFPYLLVVVMAYVGARVVYALSTEVKRARELGSYQLEEKLGQGGMGEVWRATHRLLARPAAIKVMRKAFSTTGPPEATAEGMRRFEREARVIANLRSPHTVDLYDFGVAEDGSVYYVMELLEGLDTDSLVQRFGPLPAARTIHLLRQVCHSLSEAEVHGVVHRDIKPANIFLCRYGEEYDFVKVLDFGLAKEIGETPAAALSGEQMIRGTPAFMAPEQALGHPVDARTDIYAVGCVAYWLLTGLLVFEAPTAMGLLMHHANTPPVPPSGRSELPIPPALDAIILSCLAKEPGDRPQSARELARQLSAVETSETWDESRARAWWERIKR